MSLASIDPGASGGIVWRDKDGELHAVKMPDTEGDIVDSIKTLALDGVKTIYIEKVGGFAGKGQPGSAMFNFGRNVGLVTGAVMAFNMRIIQVPPQTWLKKLGLGTKGTMTTTQWKNKLKAEAQRRFPLLKITLSTADAALIFDYAREVER